jgi:hypothetical protein
MVETIGCILHSRSTYVMYLYQSPPGVELLWTAM